jgi:hypothetical protein
MTGRPGRGLAAPGHGDPAFAPGPIRPGDAKNSKERYHGAWGKS